MPEIIVRGELGADVVVEVTGDPLALGLHAALGFERAHPLAQPPRTADVTLDLPDGGLLTIGTSIAGTPPSRTYGIGCIRTLADGSLDPTFGLDGRVRVELGGDSLAVNGAVRLPDGRVVVVDSEVVGGIRALLLVRFTGDGTLDATFGTAGTRIVDLGGPALLHVLVRLGDGRLGDGRLLIVGYSNGRDVGDFFSFACLYTPGGVLDASFGNAGTLVFDLSPANDLALGVRLLDDGTAILTGGSGYAGAQDFLLAKFDPGESTVANEANPAAHSLALDVYPNPAQRIASVAFTLDAPGAVTAEVFDVLGRRVALLSEGLRPAGRHALRWELPTLPSGVYVVRLTTPTGSAMRRLTVVR